MLKSYYCAETVGCQSVFVIVIIAPFNMKCIVLPFANASVVHIIILFFVTYITTISTIVLDHF